jgi:thiamine pyrophosphokinase
MSSHHFVKKGQEPALIIANGESCSIALLQELAAWCPTVMVLDGALDRVLKLGLAFDIVLGDFDKGIPDASSIPFPVEIIHAPDQNKNDLQKGIEELLKRGANAINILWATGKRLDHTLGNINVIAKLSSIVDIQLIDDYSRVFRIKNKFKKYYPKDKNISLIPWNKVDNINSSNLFFPLSGITLEPNGMYGTSNKVLENGIVEIFFEDDNSILFLMECNDNMIY